MSTNDLMTDAIVHATEGVLRCRKVGNIFYLRPDANVHVGDRFAYKQEWYTVISADERIGALVVDAYRAW